MISSERQGLKIALGDSEDLCSLGARRTLDPALAYGTASPPIGRAVWQVIDAGNVTDHRLLATALARYEYLYCTGYQRPVDPIPSTYVPCIALSSS